MFIVMKLLKYENYQVVPTEECFMIKPLRELFNEDTSTDKELFMQQISYLYFMVDPRSPYMDILDEEDREEKSRKPRYKNITTFPHNGVVGPYLDDYLKRVHYSGDWDVLGPAREVIEVNLVSDERIDGLLMEAEAILERWRVTA